MTENRVHQLRVAEVVEETTDARSVVFELRAEQVEHFAYRPGQFLTLRLPSDRCGSVARCYSLSSAPQVDGRLQVTVKRVAEGYGSNWICDNLRPGMAVEALAPAGVFSPASLDGEFLLFAAGSGITPVISIVKSVLAKGSGTITLVYANRDENSVIFSEELRRLVDEYPERLTVVHWLESVQGLPSTEAVRSLARPFTNREAFLCGPKPFMDATRKALRELGFPRDRVHLERFASLGGNPFAQHDDAEDHTRAGAERAATSSVEVELDGARHTFAWPAGTRLLDLLLDNGLDAPFSCREGACSACTCRVTDGEVKMLHNEALDSDDLAEGYALACQSVPVSDTVKVTYS